MNLNEIREILEYMKVQIKKLEDAVDIADNKITEIAVATAAIRYDFEQLKMRFKDG